MTQINLHTIFCHIVDDKEFLITKIESKKEPETKKKRKPEFNIMANMITEYTPLAPYDIQTYSSFPPRTKFFLSPDYVRYGIKNVMDRNLNVINISFLSSLNIILRPDLQKANIEEQNRNFILLEEFISHKIRRNYQIDKLKNTRKIQCINKDLAKNLVEGKISHDLIQSVVNIFEINLLVFDLTKMEIFFYWCKGYKYPYLNLFKNIYCMAHVQGNYEPIMPRKMSKNKLHKMYVKILTNLSEIKCNNEVKLHLPSLIVIEKWDISIENFMIIIDNFFPTE